MIGNIVEQGPETQNSAILGCRMEGGDPHNPGTQLYVINNTFVNDRPEGGTFLQIREGTPVSALVINNIFYGRGTLTTQKNATLMNNLAGKDPHFVDPVHYDYRLLPDSPARGAGIQPPMETPFPLLPTQEYVHPACGAKRINGAKPDIGAIAFGQDSAERLGPDRCREKPANNH